MGVDENNDGTVSTVYSTISMTQTEHPGSGLNQRLVWQSQRQQQFMVAHEALTGFWRIAASFARTRTREDRTLASAATRRRLDLLSRSRGDDLPFKARPRRPKALQSADSRQNPRPTECLRLGLVPRPPGGLGVRRSARETDEHSAAITTAIREEF